jgi:hypothetical protein
MSDDARLFTADHCITSQPSHLLSGSFSVANISSNLHAGEDAVAVEGSSPSRSINFFNSLAAID